MGTTTADLLTPLTTTQDIKAVKIAEAAIDDGCKGVKAATGATTVSEGTEILNSAVVIGKTASVAGLVTTATTPILEMQNSANSTADMYADADKLNNPGLKAAVIGITITDACSWGFARSFLNTIPSVVQMIPGDDPLWTQAWMKNVNESYNAVSFNSNVIMPIVNATTNSQK